MLWVSRHTCYNMVVSAVQILVNLGQATLHVPQGDHTKTGCSTCLAVILYTITSFGHCQIPSNRQLSELPLLLLLDATAHLSVIGLYPFWLTSLSASSRRCRLGEMHQRSAVASSYQTACLVLEDPVHILSAVGLRNDCHQLVLPKASIDKGIDKGGCKVLASRVYSWSGRRPPLCQVRFVNLQVWEVSAGQAG